MAIDLKKLSRFLVKAKIGAYAGEGKEIKPERAGFKELEFKAGEWYYRDSYSGFFYAPGQEIVRIKGRPVWAMAYSGGMREKYHGDYDFAKQTFGFLKEALKRVKASAPFRGPKLLKIGDFKYENKIFGDIKDFRGEERIIYKGKEVFKQYYQGGLIVGK